MTTMLKVEALETRYGQSQVLFGIEFEVRRGEVVTLLGRNGMGKTTTVRSIMGHDAALRRPDHVRGQGAARPAALSASHGAGSASCPRGAASSRPHRHGRT